MLLRIFTTHLTNAIPPLFFSLLPKDLGQRGVRTPPEEVHEPLRQGHRRTLLQRLSQLARTLHGDLQDEISRVSQSLPRSYRPGVAMHFRRGWDPGLGRQRSGFRQSGFARIPQSRALWARFVAGKENGNERKKKIYMIKVDDVLICVSEKWKISFFDV